MGSLKKSIKSRASCHPQKKMFSLALIISAGASVSYAWGTVGHTTVGYVAESFLTPKGIAYVNRVLANGESLHSVATWADQVKTTPPYQFTIPLHFVSIRDDPRNRHCGYNDNRDCPNSNCIVSAIQSYTYSAECTNSGLYHVEQYEALKFLVHFFGDIAQPLHVENRDQGGVRDVATFAGQKTTLHDTWNLFIPNKRSGELGSISAYAAYLVQRIKAGKFPDPNPNHWLSAHGLQDQTSHRNSLAAIDYANDANALNCGQEVWPFYDANPTADLSGTYYDHAKFVADFQIAKAGYRLAQWINAIANTCR